MPDPRYPPDFESVDNLDPAYQDRAAAELYRDAGGGKLVKALSQMNQALSSQAAKLEEFFNTPYSEDNARLISVTMEAIERIELQLERWHFLIYPNQKRKED